MTYGDGWGGECEPEPAFSPYYHSALLMHITSSEPPFRHGDHDHHDEMEAGLDFYAGTIA